LGLAPAGAADCWSAFSRHRELWRRGLPVPEPLAFMKAGQVGYTITRLLEGCETLFHFAFENLYRRRSSADRLTSWLKSTVGAVVTFHQAGYAHGDLHHHNVMVRSLGPAAGLEVFFTDFDACQPSEGTVPDTSQLMDLASLGASLYQLVPEYWLRKALAHYFHRCRLPRGERPRCLQAVRSGHDSFLHQYQANFDRVEGYYFSEAESQVQPVESIR
jgi:hypothetical protein